jgi:MarR family transcriptional regulator, lower aerobic nicotinate degradation pathway regulator
MPYQFLKDLLPFIEQYQANEDGAKSTQDFAKWLLKTTDNQRFNKALEKKNEDYGDTAWLYVNNSRMLINMYRYAKSYARKAIPEDSPIAFDDYSYLVVLFYEGRQTKMQLIERNIQEKSTGMEIIKRLIKLGLVQQIENEDDKRSKFVFLTPYGIECMTAIQQNMCELTKTVNGNLTLEESKTLHALLEKLDYFHNPIFLGK